MSAPLALLGGTPIRSQPYPVHRTTGEEEKKAVLRVMESGVLSAFEGTNNEFFRGGPEVQALEAEWAAKFDVKHAVAVNSATSGLLAAVGAAGVGPGDEVIVTPFTMSGTIAGILAYNAVPVFADVDLETFNLDPAAVERLITSRTKAILPVHIFGHPVDMQPLLDLARQRKIAVIEDAAQSPGALYEGRQTGTLGDLGVFSLNCNKHIQCGEGGIVVTDHDELAQRVRLIRNHAEAVIASGMKVTSMKNMLGFNLRMTELEAAVARSQLQKLDDLLARRLELVHYLNNKLKQVPGLKLPVVRPGCTHVYYRYALSIERRVLPIYAKDMVRALNAEGLDFYVSYMRPLYRQPIFEGGHVKFVKGECPNAESLEEFVISTEVVRPPQTFKDMDQIAQGLLKVIENKDHLLQRAAIS